MSHALPLAIDPYLRDWLDLLLRWLHVIAAIAWIGTSFYFVLLDQSLRPVERELDRDEGVGGELWEVHGGGFYRVQKFTVAPRRDLPEHLAWFKWEAYATWLSGFALLLVLYYLEAAGKLVAPGSSLEPWQAVIASLGLLVAAWIAYDLVCTILEGHELALGAAILGLTTLAAWAAGELFAPRAAWLQVGAMLGTVMAANVFFVIIPAHRALIRAKEAGQDPDPAPALKGKQRSVHNNYLTLPVLLTMLAGHSSFLVGRDHAWLILIALMLLGLSARVFYNLRHGGRTLWVIPAAALLALIVLAVALRPNDAGTATPAGTYEIAAGRIVFATNCSGCHTLADADATGTVGPNLDGGKPTRNLVRTTVTEGRGGMPSFAGKLTPQAIDAVAAYVSAVAGK